MATSAGTPLPSVNCRRTMWPGPFGATMPTVTFAGGLINPKWMLRPCAKASAAPGLRLAPLQMTETAFHTAEANAGRLAEWLAAQPGVDRVYYPGLASHPGHALARTQMRDFGGMISPASATAIGYSDREGE